ncbi:MAG: aldo/keto reductase [Spirochaetales bacterium]
MKTLKLGGTGGTVSALCLGTMDFGVKTEPRQAEALLDRYCEAGGTFLDTANNYGRWTDGGGRESETVLGEWMRTRKNRNSLFLATKVGANPPARGWSLKPQLIREELEESLRRLGTDHVDLYYAHIDVREDPLEETLGVFDQLHREGKFLALGCSNYRAWRIEQARQLSKDRGFPAYCCAQLRHTYLRPVPGASFRPQVFIDEETRDYARANKDFLLLGYSIALGGAYASRPEKPVPLAYRGPDTDDRLRVLAEVSRETGASAVQVVLAWMLASAPTVLPLISSSTLQQLDENLGSLEVVLSSEQMVRLDQAGARAC